MPIALNYNEQDTLTLGFIVDQHTKLALKIEIGQDFNVSLMIFSRLEKSLTKQRFLLVKNLEFAILGVNGQEFANPISKKEIASKLPSI